MPLTPGAMFERYEIESVVGRGGMGEVYRAIDTRLHRPVALKVLRTDREAATEAVGGVARLLREARAAAAFNHAHSVAIYELGEAEGIPYIAMEFVNGASLRAAVGDATIPLRQKVSWLVDAARALHAAHKAGLVHRDVKPGNIMVSDEGVVKVLDFGLAKPVSAKKDPSGFQTQMGQVLGTPKYMAPEQLDGEPADAKADQFAFGQVAYELLSGRYAGGPLAAMPERLDRIAPGASADLAISVERMMARRAGDRFATMDDVARALEAATRTLGAEAAAAARGDAGVRRSSDAPTREVRQPAPVDADVSVSHARPSHKTMPLAVPMNVAVGAPAMSAAPSHRTAPMHAAQTPSQGVPSPAFSQMPPSGSSGRLPSAPSIGAPPPGGAPSVASGVYASRPGSPASLAPHAHGAAHAVGPSPASGPRSARRSEPPWALIIVVVVVVALAGGLVGAILLR